jgi:hypothetical protein
MLQFCTSCTSSLHCRSRYVFQREELLATRPLLAALASSSLFSNDPGSAQLVLSHSIFLTRSRIAQSGRLQFSGFDQGSRFSICGSLQIMNPSWRNADVSLQDSLESRSRQRLSDARACGEKFTIDKALACSKLSLDSVENTVRGRCLMDTVVHLHPTQRQTYLSCFGVEFRHDDWLTAQLTRASHHHERWLRGEEGCRLFLKLWYHWVDVVSRMYPREVCLLDHEKAKRRRVEMLILSDMKVELKDSAAVMLEFLAEYKCFVEDTKREHGENVIFVKPHLAASQATYTDV